MDRFRNILLGVGLSRGDLLVDPDGPSGPGRVAFEKAAWIARRNRARLHVVTCLDVGPHAEALLEKERAARSGESLLAQAEAVLGALVAPLRQEGLAATTAVEFGPPARRLVEDCVRNGRDLLVVGTRDRGAVVRNVLGSTSLGVLRRCPVPVWVARKGPDHAFDVVLAAVDFDERAAAVLEVASAFATDTRAKLVVLHAADLSAEQVLHAGAATPETIETYREERLKTLRADLGRLVRQHLGSEARVAPAVVEGRPREVVVDQARELSADLVVIGSSTHGAIAGVLLGDTAEGVLEDVETSLVVLKPQG